MLNYVYDEREIQLVERYEQVYKDLEKEWLNKCVNYKKLLTLVIFPLMLGAFGMSAILIIVDFSLMNLLALSIQTSLFCFMYMINEKIEKWETIEFYDGKIRNEIANRGV